MKLWIMDNWTDVKEEYKCTKNIVYSNSCIKYYATHAVINHRHAITNTFSLIHILCVHSTLFSLFLNDL